MCFAADTRGQLGRTGRPGRGYPLLGVSVKVIGQLRANQELAFPGAIGLFTKAASGISLAFLTRFPTAAKAAWLSPGRLGSWLRSSGYTGGISARSRTPSGILARAWLRIIWRCWKTAPPSIPPSTAAATA